jgi:alpha-ribazole phosphatase
LGEGARRTGGRLVAIRHPAVAVEGTCYGRSEVALADPAGAPDQLLAALGPQGLRFDQVWSSPLARCAQPARAIADRLGLVLHIDDRLTEVDFGRWEGRTWREIEAEDPAGLATWMSRWLTEAPPGGETVAAFDARVAGWVAVLAPTASHLLVGHAGAVRALRVIVGRSTWREAMDAPFAALAIEVFRLPFGRRSQR